MFNKTLFRLEAAKLELDKDVIGQQLRSSIETETPLDNLVEIIHPYFSSVNQVTSFLAYAPPSFKQYQLALYAKVLSRISPDAVVEQIQKLPIDDIKNMLQGALNHCSKQFKYQNLVELCFFELIQRRVKEHQDFDNLIQTLTADIAFCKEHLPANTDLCIMDNLAEYRFKGKTILDLIKDFKPELTPEQQYQLRGLLEILRFNQDRRKEYFDKVEKNLGVDYSWLANTLSEQAKADNHISDEKYANLKREALVSNLKSSTLQKLPLQNWATVDGIEFKAVKSSLGEGVESLLSQATFIPTHDQFQALLIKAQDAQESDKASIKKELKKLIETPRVVAYSSNPTKFAVRLHFASDAVIEKVIQGAQLSSNEKLIFDIHDSDNLNQSLIQEELKHRERLRIAEATVKKQDIQKQINELRKEQIANQEQLKKLGGGEEVKQIKTLQQKIAEINVQLGEGKERQLAEVQKKRTSIQSFLRQVIEDTESKTKEFKTKQEEVRKDEDELNKLINYLREHPAWANSTIGGNTSITLSQRIKILREKLQQDVPKLEFSQQVLEQSSLRQQELTVELHSLESKLAFLTSQKELSPEESNKLTQQKKTLESQLDPLIQKAQGWEKHEQLQNSQKRLASEIESKNQKLKELDAELQTKRDMFDSLRNSFPAASIKDLSLSSQAETHFRQLLELKSVLTIEDWSELKRGFAAETISIKDLDNFLLSPDSQLLDKIDAQNAIKQLFDTAFEKVKRYPKTDMPLKSQREIFENVKQQLEKQASKGLENASIRLEKILDGQQNPAGCLTAMHIDSIQRRLDVNEKALAVSQNQEHLKILVQQLPSDKAVQHLKAMLKEAYPKDDLKKYLGINDDEINKLHQDIDAAIDRLNNMARCLKEGKSFIANDIASYKTAIEQLKTSYREKEPKFESLSFKVKHSAKNQTIQLKNAAGEVVHVCELNLDNALPFSLRKDSNGSCWLSYGGSRGARVSKLSNAPGRLFSNLWMIGHGQYGSVAQSTNLFTLDEVAVKKVYTQSDQALDAGLLKNLLSRELFARADNLSDSERRINEIFIKQLSTAVPQSVQQSVKLGDYSADAAAVVRLDAQILAKGNSFDKFSEADRNSHSKADEAYHNPSQRQGFDVNKSIGDSVSMCGAMADKLTHEHTMGFMHNDLKPENIMLFKGKDGRWQASLIDRATNAFQLEYRGEKKSPQEVFKEVFPGMDASQDDSSYKSNNGFYVTQTGDKFYYGKEAHLQISYGARNCTLAYIAPATVEKPGGTSETKMTASDTRMDDWALTAMTFGVCRKDYYLDLAKGRSVADYAVPGIIRVTGANLDELEIESKQKFNQYFGVEGHENLMFIPANKREGEPRYLYRDLGLLKKQLNQQSDEQNQQFRQETIVHIDSVLKKVSDALLIGEGLTSEALKQTLIEVDKINQDSLRLIQGQAKEQVIDKHQKFKEALEISSSAVDEKSDRTSNLRAVLADVGKKNVLDVLCLFPSDPEQISQAKKQLTTFDLSGMFFGQSNVSQNLIEQCLFEQQEEMAVFLIETLKSNPNLKKSMQEKNLLELAVQMNMPKAFDALFAIVEQNDMQGLLTKKPSFAKTTTKWSMNVLVSAIIQGQDEIFKAIVDKTQDDSTVRDSIYEAMLFCAKNNKYEYFQTLRTKFPSIKDIDIHGKKPPSAFHLFMMFPSGVEVLQKMDRDVKNAFIQKYPGPVLIAGGCGNFAVVKEIFEAGSLLDEDFVSYCDTNKKNILHHLLNRDATKNLDLIIKLLSGKQSVSLLRGVQGEESPLDGFAKSGAHNDVKLAVIMSILEGLRDIPEKQMQVLWSIKDWMEQNPEQLCGKILEAECIESNRVYFLKMLKNEGFSDIKQKYMSDGQNPQEKLRLNFATIERFIQPELAPFLSSQAITDLKQMAEGASKQDGHDEKSKNNLSFRLSVLELTKQIQEAKYQDDLDRLLQKFQQISALVGEGLEKNHQFLEMVTKAIETRVDGLAKELAQKEGALQQLIQDTKQDISAQQAREIQALQGEINQLAAKYKEYRPTMEGVEGLAERLQGVDKAIETARAAQQAAEQTIQTIGQKVGELQQQLKEKASKQEVAQLKEKLENQTHELNGFKQSLARALSVIDTLEAKFAEQTMQNKELMGRLSEFHLDRALLNQLCRQYQADNEELRQLLQNSQEDRQLSRIATPPMHPANFRDVNSGIEVASVATQTLDEFQSAEYSKTPYKQNAEIQTDPQFNASAGLTISPKSFFQSAPLKEFKLFGASMEKPVSVPSDKNRIIESINFDEKVVSAADSKKFHTQSGHTVYTNQGQPYQFHYDPNNPPAKAQLLKNQLTGENDENRQLKIALTVMNMIENVLAKGEELHVDTKDPFIAVIANLYIKKIKEIKIGDKNPFSNTQTSVSQVTADEYTSPSSVQIFEEIMKSPAYKKLVENPIEVSWIENALSSKANAHITHQKLK